MFVVVCLIVIPTISNLTDFCLQSAWRTLMILGSDCRPVKPLSAPKNPNLTGLVVLHYHNAVLTLNSPVIEEAWNLSTGLSHLSPQLLCDPPVCAAPDISASLRLDLKRDPPALWAVWESYTRLSLSLSLLHTHSHIWHILTHTPRDTQIPSTPSLLLCPVPYRCGAPSLPPVDCSQGDIVLPVHTHKHTTQAHRHTHTHSRTEQLSHYFTSPWETHRWASLLLWKYVANPRQMDPKLQSETDSAPQIAGAAHRDKRPGRRHLIVWATLQTVECSTVSAGHMHLYIWSRDKICWKLNCEGPILPDCPRCCCSIWKKWSSPISSKAHRLAAFFSFYWAGAMSRCLWDGFQRFGSANSCSALGSDPKHLKQISELPHVILNTTCNLEEARLQ